jgi:hypothetical protein
MATFLFIVAPPSTLLFFYKILGPDARKKIQSALTSLLTSATESVSGLDFS